MTRYALQAFALTHHASAKTLRSASRFTPVSASRTAKQALHVKSSCHASRLTHHARQSKLCTPVALVTHHASRITLHASLLTYSGELTDRMNTPVLTVVIYSEYRGERRASFGDKKLRPKPEYTSDIKGEVINRFTYLDIWLMDYEEEIRAGKLAPLV